MVSIFERRRAIKQKANELILSMNHLYYTRLFAAPSLRVTYTKKFQLLTYSVFYSNKTKLSWTSGISVVKKLSELTGRTTLRALMHLCMLWTLPTTCVLRKALKNLPSFSVKRSSRRFPSLCSQINKICSSLSLLKKSRMHLPWMTSPLTFGTFRLALLWPKKVVPHLLCD